MDDNNHGNINIRTCGTKIQRKKERKKDTSEVASFAKSFSMALASTRASTEDILILECSILADLFHAGQLGWRRVQNWDREHTAVGWPENGQKC